MKTFRLILLAGLVFAACAQAETNDNGTTAPSKRRPVVGMTKDDAKSYYGTPFTQMSLAKGERWYYRLKFNEVYGRALVPFYFDSPNVRWGSIDFGPDGRVKAFDWRAPLQQ